MEQRSFGWLCHSASVYWHFYFIDKPKQSVSSFWGMNQYIFGCWLLRVSWNTKHTRAPAVMAADLLPAVCGRPVCVSGSDWDRCSWCGLSAAADSHRSKRSFHAWSQLTALPPFGSSCGRIILTCSGPWSIHVHPPNLLFMALWHFLSMCVFSGPAHMISLWIHIMLVSVVISTAHQRPAVRESGHGSMW